MGVFDRVRNGWRGLVGHTDYAEPTRNPERIAAVEGAFDANGLLVPSARQFSGLINTFSRVYSYRWDEALRNFPANAQAMSHDAYLTALREERTIPLTRWKWQIELNADDDPKLKDDPEAEKIRAGLEARVKAIPRLHEFRRAMRHYWWYGRYGCQMVYGRDAGGTWNVTNHAPVDGDSILTDFDGHPCIAINPTIRGRYPDGDTTVTDRMPVLRLAKPEHRRRFVIARHEVQAGSYFYPETAGMIGGVGFRHQVYWAWWLRDEMLASAVAFLDKVGTMGLLVVYYEEGNEKSRLKANETAKEASRRNAIAVPRAKSPNSRDTAGIELIPANMTGVQFLQGFIGEYFEKHIERLAVGQSLSAGTEGGGLGGTGVAALHFDTKYMLLASDADAMDSAYTEDLLTVLQDLNYPGSRAKYRYRFRHLLPDPSNSEKLVAARQVWDMGGTLPEDDLREMAGVRKPNDGEPTVSNRAAAGENSGKNSATDLERGGAKD